MHNPPTTDGFNSSHKTVQFRQFNDEDFETPFDDDDDDEYPVSLFSLEPTAAFPLTAPKGLKSCDMIISN